MSCNLRQRLITVLLILAFPISSAVAASDLLFHNYASDSGLPNMGICSFAQDCNGAIWVGTDEGICMFDGDAFITPMFLKQEPFSSAYGRWLCIDSRNTLWLASENSMICYNLDTGLSRLFEEIRASQTLCDGDGVVWTKCQSGLICYNYETDKWDYSYADLFSPVHICTNTQGVLCATATDGSIYIKKRENPGFSRIQILSDKNSGNNLTLVNVTACDERRLLYSTSDNSVFCLDFKTGESRKIFDGHIDGKDAILTGILANSPEEFWVITDSGLYIYDDATGICTQYLSQSGDPYSLVSSKLRCLFKDNKDRVWLGSFYNGISRLVDPETGVKVLRRSIDSPERSLKGRVIRSICSSEEGVVWTASEDGFLEKVYPDGTIVSFGAEDKRKSRNNTYQSIAYADGKIYVADLGEGLFVFDSESLKLLKKYNVGDNYCTNILLTRQGEILAGASNGLFRLDRTSDSFVRIDSISDNFVSTLYEDRSGNIWTSVNRYGTFILSPYDFKANPLKITNTERDIRINAVCLFEDKDGKMWAATNGNGLYILTPEKYAPWNARYSHLTKENGIPSNLCCAITQDFTGKMWISTKNGVVTMDPRIYNDFTEYKVFGERTNFSLGSVYKSPDGEIYFGSSNGMVIFNPEAIPQKQHNLFIVDIAATKNNSITALSEDIYSASPSRSIKIHSKDVSSLTIRLMCVKNDFNEVVSYHYLLTGKGRKIENISNDKQITYSNLSGGKYKLSINVNRDESPEASISLLIRVIPPIYSSTLAKFLYVLLAVCLLFSLTYYKLTSSRKDKERAQERLESYKKQEIYESKINFFTNISHEIRTPLTLIKVPLDKIMESKAYLPESEYDMKCIQKSTDRLLEVTDQILDFRRMENGSFNLSFSQTDLTKLIGEICSRMEGLAKEYSVSLLLELPDHPVSIMCAPGSVDKIITNLVMNGIKYCFSTVKVVLCDINEETVRVSVMSDGKPIEQEEREKIFEPFYQSTKTHSRLPMNEGAGLGLSFARSLANLHKGTLMLDSEYEHGNSFVLELPVGQSAEKKEQEVDIDVQGKDFESGKNAILIVEDDPTLNDYIKTELSNEYVVYQAYNGNQAITVLNDISISLIVSDIMMPEMNGCELVDVVKNTLRYSHIPIILLTAVTDYDTQLNSLHSGADGYITKPFSIQILRATIFNILRNREILFEKFSSMPYTRPENVVKGQDDEFMGQLHNYVMENISNQDLSVFDLADRMNTSRSTLFRKIRANTGMNINEYIRVCRLKKAAELLATQKYQTKEVAYMVGYTSLSYFTKSFQKQFNISPSSLIKKN